MIAAEAAATSGGAASAKARPEGAALNRYPVPDWVPVPSAAWVHQQVYLHPYPKELMLWNHVQIQTSRLAEACEQLTGTLPVLLQR